MTSATSPRISMHLSALALALGVLPVHVWIAAAPPPPYAVHRTGDVVQLEDAARETTVSVVPPVGNVAFEMTVKGTNVLRFPYASVDEFKAKPRLSGIPFLGPWANRLDETAFYANGKKYAFNMELGNVRGPRPIHGLLASASQWRVVEARADTRAAWVTSRLEFFREPAWMAQFPFAHTIEMTYRLEGGVLEVRTAIENLSAEPMPIAVGYHPYFQVTDAPRDEWTIAVGARTQWLLSPEKIPTGETRPIEQFFPNPQQVPLGAFDLDHVFGDLVRDASGRAVMSVTGRAQHLDVVFGSNYRAAVIYAPKPPASQQAAPSSATTPAPPASPVSVPAPRTDAFICFEPMAGITNALNLAHRGLYKDLQTVAPGQTWRESFWIRPSGF